MKDTETKESLLWLDALLNAERYTSVLKGIPYNETNLRGAKWLVRMFNKCTLSDIRVRYRGKRLSHPNHTLKSEATHFDVYVNGV